MKKKLIISALCVLALAGGLLVWRFVIGSRPLKNLRTEEVASATVELYPPNVTLSLTGEEIDRLVSILNDVAVYQRDDSYSEYSGQAVIFTLTKTDGTQLQVQAYSPFAIIDGAGYQAKYEPCEDLSRLGNDILRKLSWEEQQELLARGRGLTLNTEVKKKQANACLLLLHVGTTYLPGPSPAKYCRRK